MFLKSWTTWISACSLLLVSSAAISEERPNILLVMADDLGWTDLGAYGSEIETPNLDMLAQQGMVFTDFHASVSCSPTRSMLMSGNDNHIAGLGTMSEMLVANQVGQPGYEGHLNDRVASMAEVLQGAGYHTYLSGKWHLGHEAGERPFDRGFETTFSMLVGGASHWNDMRGILPQDHPALYSANGKLLDSLPANFYSSRSYTDILIDMIRTNHGDDKPFLAYLAFTAPHDPVHVPEPWLSKYSGRYDKGYDVLKDQRWNAAKDLGRIPADATIPKRQNVVKPWDELSDEQKTTESRGMEVYAGMVEAMDYNYGRVIDYLGDIGELDNTVIVFLSDNGANPFYSTDYPGAADPEFVNLFDHSLENLGRPGSNYAYGPGFATGSNGPLDWFKLTVGEGGIRVPLIVAGPGIVKGQATDAFAYVWDILPTLLDVTGVEYPATFNGHDVEQPRGRSMMPLISGAAKEIYGPEEFLGGEMGEGKWMRQGSYKAVLVPPPYGDSEWRLFDVKNDPGESNDLAGEMPEMLKTLIAAWNIYATEVGVVPAKL